MNLMYTIQSKTKVPVYITQKKREKSNRSITIEKNFFFYKYAIQIKVLYTIQTKCKKQQQLFQQKCTHYSKKKSTCILVQQNVCCNNKRLATPHSHNDQFSHIAYAHQVSSCQSSYPLNPLPHGSPSLLECSESHAQAHANTHMQPTHMHKPT